LKNVSGVASFGYVSVIAEILSAFRLEDLFLEIQKVVDA